MLDKTANNDFFYGQVVRTFYNHAVSRHPKWLLVKNYEYGFTICELPGNFETYFMNVEASARRNYKKALRLGYRMRRFDFNGHLEDIRQIWKSTPIRQGELLPENIRTGDVRPIADPP